MSASLGLYCLGILALVAPIAVTLRIANDVFRVDPTRFEAMRAERTQLEDAAGRVA